MVLIHVLQEIAAAVAVDRVTAFLLLCCALVTTVSGWRGARDHLWRGTAGVAAVMVFSTFLLLRPHGGAPMSVVLVVAAAMVILLIVDVFIPDRPHLQPRAEPEGGSRHSRRWIGAASSLLLVFLLADLGAYTGWLMVWESPVVDGFAEAFYEKTTLFQYLLTCLGWNFGLVSNGHLTVLYGVFTYLLWAVVGISPVTLRLAAAVLAAACLVPTWFLARRLGPPKIAAMAVAALCLNPALIFYGRYGTSLSGTLFGTSVAILLCATLAGAKATRWWHGLVTGVAVFVATLGYSPGRLAVVSALGVMALVLVRDRRGWTRQRWVAALLLLVLVATAWAVEAAHGKTRFFVGARGEQIVTMMEQSVRIETYLGREVDPMDLVLRDRVEMVGNLLRLRAPEMFRVWGYPFSDEVLADSVVQTDPPRLPLYPQVLAVFALWGLIATLRRPLDGVHPFLLGWVAVICLPLLLTTRIDTHRLMMTIVPLSLWAALGLQRATRIMDACRVPRRTQVGCAALLLIGIAAGNSAFLYHRSSPPIRLSAGVLAEIEEIEGPVLLVFATDHRDLARVELALLDRQRHSDERLRVAVSENVKEELLREGGPRRTAIDELTEDLERSTLILAPAGRFHAVAWALHRRGAHVVERGSSQGRFWRVNRSGAPPTHAAEGLPPEAPSADPFTVVFDPPNGRQAPVGEAKVVEMTFGFAPPRIDRDWEGRPIVMGGVTYDHGIGMHAWTRMSFEVPVDAVEFHAVIGLSDRVRDCEEALVGFEVRGNDDRLLFESAPVNRVTPPIAVDLPIAGERKITLILTEGGNGRDCDHGNWAAPAFLLAER